MRIGVSIGQLIYFKEFINKVFCEFKVESFCENDAFHMTIIFIVTILLTLISDPHHLYYPSMISFFTLSFGLLCLIFYNFHLMGNLEGNGEYFGKIMGKVDLMSFPMVFGITLYAFELMAILLDLRNSMHDRTKVNHTQKVSFWYAGVLFFLTAFTSIMALRDGTPEVVLLSLPKNNFTLFVNIIYGVGVIIAFPIFILPGILILENWIQPHKAIVDEEG
mmetsp:Transcript_34004/g.30783  ORF Transcript_34004/g.30783 Transcript_34004/m.30783 type:complete len:220 (+) Transcript_34004:241-900(+)|eukprot:CAMPEP_0114575542 /NCGR_PEP_ID=MMETSP0125-20121206/394_1 /TAXON_ID=485358 ORGANISM="Aristerostoma sp., Strain ATCC 50986" /NCGR_SAMPLE_ID=MMETSP0125 /ASSEMBLY_ACC=CAM_ASM_000245 /LENGTH=219 /DNA_ID=CAMNT_0001763341 /DNA_START=388 /DNA_END=1047 /DNA_ORIENTATION=+